MEWQQEQTPNGVGQLLVRVMTDEQIECLRRQIAAYAAISEQLLQMHNSFTADQHDFAGKRLGDLPSDPLSLMATWGCKMIPRQKRWAPTPSQLKELERLFKEGNVAPSKEKIKEITTELSQHGQISDANAYNWFQNRRARSKRKQLAPMPNSAEKVKSPKGKKTRL